MRSVSFSDKSEDSINSSDSYRENNNILIEFAKSVKASTVKSFSFLKRAKTNCYQVNKHTTSSWDIGKTGSIGSDSASFDGNCSTSSTSSHHGKDAASLGSIMINGSTSPASSNSPVRTRSSKKEISQIHGRSYACTQSELRIEQLKSEIEALKPQTIKRLI